MKEKLKFRIFGLSLTAFLLLSSSIFVYILADTGFLTWQLIVICAAVLLLLAVTVFLLSIDSRKKARSIIAAVLAFVIFIVQCVGSYYILIGRATLEKITKPKGEYSEIGIYVRKDDKAEKITDIKGYTLGILGVLDRDATDFTLLKIAKEVGGDNAKKEYTSVEELMDALLDLKEVEVIVLNKSFLHLLQEIEGHREDLEKIREIHCVESKADSNLNNNEQVAINEDVFTVYISGIDTYGSLSRKSRSDVNIIATVNVKTGQVLLLSTPRDYFVPLSISNGIPDKLTHAGIYGINVSKDTLGLLYGINIDYYFRVNFDGFKEIIDALGGITVVSEYNFKSKEYTFVKGENFLNGKQALAFSRNRYAFASGDRQRGKNQMAVIKGVIDKATGPAILMNYKSTLDGLAGAFETNMPYEKITKLIQNQIKMGTKWNVVSYSADGTGASRKPYSLRSNAYVMIPNQATVDKAKELINQVKNGEVPVV